MPANRSYTLKIFNTPAPVPGKLNINGSSDVVPGYDAATRCTIVEIPSSACDKQVKVSLEYEAE